MKRILFVQHGNYADAYKAFAQGAPETYRDQRRSVDFVAALARDAHTSTLAFVPKTFEETLAPGLLAYGMPREAADRQGVARFLDKVQPTHIVLRTPHRVFLQEASKRSIHVLPVFADLFARGGLRNAYRHFRLRRTLQKSKAPCVSNHSVNASHSLVDIIGISPDQVVPWDWSPVPMHDIPKAGVQDPTRPTIFFAGVMSEDKGVGDCLNALVRLRTDGTDWRMTLAGKDTDQIWQRRAADLGLKQAVTFLGMIPNTQVRVHMRAHDFVVVPSRHSYPEGLPNTIYEALASRSVLVMSDHPSFVGRLVPDRDCLVFEASNPQKMADCFHRARVTKSLYTDVSQNAEAAHDNLYVGIEWTALVSQFLQDPTNESGWVQANALPRFA